MHFVFNQVEDTVAADQLDVSVVEEVQYPDDQPGTQQLLHCQKHDAETQRPPLSAPLNPITTNRIPVINPTQSHTKPNQYQQNLLQNLLPKGSLENQIQWEKVQKKTLLY